MPLRERGWSIAAAAREVGVSRSTVYNWARGHKVYRRGRVIGFAPALERLAVRQVSAQCLSQDERIQIADLQQEGLTFAAITERMGRSKSTILRELRRSAGKNGYHTVGHGDGVHGRALTAGSVAWLAPRRRPSARAPHGD